MAISRFWNQLYSAIVFLLVCGMVSTLSAKPNQKKLPQTGKAILHFRPEGMKAGDVIPFFWKGSYHLFYLEGPDWGHIVSQDLLHWQELPKALVKGADPQGPEVLSNITAHSFFSTPVRTAMIRSETKRSCRPEVLI